MEILLAKVIRRCTMSLQVSKKEKSFATFVAGCIRTVLDQICTLLPTASDGHEASVKQAVRRRNLDTSTFHFHPRT